MKRSQDLNNRIGLSIARRASESKLTGIVIIIVVAAYLLLVFFSTKLPSNGRFCITDCFTLITYYFIFVSLTPFTNLHTSVKEI